MVNDVAHRCTGCQLEGQRAHAECIGVRGEQQHGDGHGRKMHQRATEVERQQRPDAAKASSRCELKRKLKRELTRPKSLCLGHFLGVVILELRDVDAGNHGAKFLGRLEHRHWTGRDLDR